MDDNPQLVEQELPQKRRRRFSNAPLFFAHPAGPDPIPMDNLFTEIPLTFQLNYGEPLDVAKAFNRNHKIIIKHSTLQQFQVGLKKILRQLNQVYNNTVTDLVNARPDLSIKMSNGILQHQKILKQTYPNVTPVDPSFPSMNFTLNDYYTLNRASVKLRFDNLFINRMPVISSIVTQLQTPEFLTFSESLYNAFHDHNFEHKASQWDYNRILQDKTKGFYSASLNGDKNTSIYGHFPADIAENFREQPMSIILHITTYRYALPANHIVNEVCKIFYEAFLDKLPVSIGYDAIENKFLAPTVLRKMAQNLPFPTDAAHEVNSYLMMGKGTRKP